MAALKEYLVCSCGEIMFPCAFDSRNKTISYKCIECDNTEAKAFSDVMLQGNESVEYFVLDDSGEITWKCPSHGYVDLFIDSYFFEQYDMRGFKEAGCPMCYKEEAEYDGYWDERYDDNEEFLESEEAKTMINNIICNLSAEQQREFALQEYDQDLDDYNGDCAEAIRYEYIHFLQEEPFNLFLKDLEERVQSYKEEKEYEDDE